MGRYASDTQVNMQRSRAEIERTLTRYGATGFMYGSAGDRAVVAFEAEGRRVKFTIPIEPIECFRLTPSQQFQRSDDGTRSAWEKAQRQKWRALALVIKAKLEAVESGIVEFEDEFLAHIVLPDGRTMGELARPQLRIAYESGDVPPLLGYGGGA
jgi:hypothetical protein